MRKVKGFIDQIDENGIGGWIVDQENLEAMVYIDVEIGTSQFLQIPCNQLRKGLKKRGIHPTGKCGFRINYPIDQSIPLAAITVKYKNIILRKSRKIQADKLQFIHQNSDTPLLFFLHIPKTAGTSFRLMLSEQIQQAHTYPNKTLIAANKELYPTFEQIFTLTNEELAQLKLISGHYTAVKASLIENRRTIVFLRDPIERCISHLYHLKLKDERFKSSRISLEEVFNQTKRTLNNTQVRYLSTIPCTITLETRHLESAKEFLSLCDFVGITEKFERSIAKFAKILDYPKPKILEVNTTKQKHKPPISSALREQIILNNQYDIALYEHAIKIFQEESVVE